MMKYIQKPACLLFIFALFFSACTKSRDQELAEQVVEKYHELYNEQKYEDIFLAAHEDAKRTKSKEALGLALAQAFEKYGKHIGSELIYTKISPLPESGERQVEFVYKSKFENGERNETFLIVTDGEKAALYGIGELSDEELDKLKSR